MAEVQSVASNKKNSLQPSSSVKNIKIKSNFLRSLNGVADHDYIQKSQKNLDNVSQSSRSNFLGNSKGKKPSRFNEDLGESDTKSIAVGDYLNSGRQSESGQKTKINLRTINNPAQREQFRKLQKNRMLLQHGRTSSRSKQQDDATSQVSFVSRASIPGNELSVRTLRKLDQQSSAAHLDVASQSHRNYGFEEVRKRPGTAQSVKSLASKQQLRGSDSRSRLRAKRDIMNRLESLNDQQLHLIQDALEEEDLDDQNEYGLVGDTRRASLAQLEPYEDQEEDGAALLEKDYFNVNANGRRSGAGGAEDDQTTALTRNSRGFYEVPAYEEAEDLSQVKVNYTDSISQ